MGTCRVRYRKGYGGYSAVHMGGCGCGYWGRECRLAGGVEEGSVSWISRLLGVALGFGDFWGFLLLGEVDFKK